MNFLTFLAQTIQNRHFVTAARAANPANQSSAGRERADRTFGGRERVTEQVRRDYTKYSKFCLTNDKNRLNESAFFI